MRKIINNILLFAISCISSVSFMGCADYLDVSDEVQETLKIEEVFNNPLLTRRWHSNLFIRISEYSSTGVQATGFKNPWSNMAGETIVNTSWMSNLMISGYNASTAPFHRWSELYVSIRDAMIFLERVKPLGTDNDVQKLPEKDVNRMRAEVQFLIAYYYFSLFELYGPVPIVDILADPTTSTIDFVRASVDETIKHIDNLLIQAIESGYLPKSLIKNPNLTGNDRYNLNEIVRPTKSAALALRAKLWVYAASPLFNGGYEEALQLTDKTGKRLFPDNDNSKWIQAKLCLEDVLFDAKENGYTLFEATDKDGLIDPNQSVYGLFQAYNDEILWATGVNEYNNGGGMDWNTRPTDVYNGWCHVGVPQNTVDAFFVKDGLTITDNSPEYNEMGFSDVMNPCNENKSIDSQVFNMYANREPRFYAAITYQGKSWHIQPKEDYFCGFAKGGGCDNSNVAHPRAGYLYSKFTNRTILDDNTGNHITRWGRPSILFRLADFYLYYAEVCNEIDPNDTNVIDYLDKVRKRAGISGYRELAATGKKNIIGDQSLQRKAIQQERRVELFAEGQRYFDIRRWGECEDTKDASNYYIYGMNMNGDAESKIGTLNSFYRRVLVEKRSWKRAMYLHPIPFDELQKSTLLVQNPLW